MTEFHVGIRVRWDSHGGRATSAVVRKISSDSEAAGRVARATADDLQYLVRSDNGGDAVHKPSALTGE